MAGFTFKPIIVKNVSGVTKIYGAVTINNADHFEDTGRWDFEKWSSDIDTLVDDIAAGDIVINNGTSDLSADDGISWFLNDLLYEQVAGSAVTSVRLGVEAKGALNIPGGTTAERPSNPVAGDVRFNTDVSVEPVFELYDGTSWIVTSDKWATFIADSGSVSANGGVDTFTIAGGTGITTAISGDTVTITASGGGDELVKVSANDTTAGYLNGKLIGTTDEIGLTENNDAGNETLSVGIADNPVLPGTEGTVPPVGTTAQRPGTPDNGELRFNSDTNLMEYYNGTSWISMSGTGTGPGTIAGSIVGYHFLLDKFEYGSWLGTTTKHIPSDEVQYIMPFGAEIVALTYSCETNNSDVDLFIETSPDGSGASNSTVYNWTITDARTARISTLTGAGGPSGIVLAAGTKIAVFAEDPGGGTEPGDVVVSIYIQWTDEIQEEDSETWAGDFS